MSMRMICILVGLLYYLACLFLEECLSTYLNSIVRPFCLYDSFALRAIRIRKMLELEFIMKLKLTSLITLILSNQTFAATGADVSNKTGELLSSGQSQRVAVLNKAAEALSEGRVIITGSRIEESIDEVPASVTIISREELEEQLLVTSDLQTILSVLVPGLAPSTGSSSNSSVTLRGRSPLVMIDGVPQSTPLRNGSLGLRTIDIEAIERIEVIKGATSIYGNGAAGGIINYITKEPAKGAHINGSLGLSTKFSAVEFDDSLGYRFNGVVSGSIDDFSYVLSGSFEEYGQQKDANGDILGTKYGLSESEASNYFLKAGYAFNDDKFVQLTYNYYDAQQNADLIDVVNSVNTGQPTYSIPLPEGVEKRGEPQGPRGNNNLMVKYVDEYLFSNTQLTLDYYDQTIENVFFFSPVLSNPEAGLDGGQSMIKSDKKGARVVFNSQFTSELIDTTLIYGIDALNDVTSQPLLDGRMWVPEMDMDNLAGFVQSKLKFNEKWIMKVGVRHEKIDLSVDDYDTLRLCKSTTLCSVPVAVKGGELNYEATTYNFGLRYNMNSAFNPFVSYSQGADISDLGRLLRTATVSDINLVHTEASIIDNYEIGFNSQFEKLQVELSTYRSTSELGTSNKYDPATGVYMPVRAPQKIWGAELAVDYAMSDELSLNASYSWVEGKNRSTDEYLGGRQIAAPKLSVLFNWQPLDETSLAVNYLNVGSRQRFEQVDGLWVGDKGPVESYDVINLSVSQYIDDFKIFLGVENLLNNDYYPAKSQVYTYSGYNVKGVGRSINIGMQLEF